MHGVRRRRSYLNDGENLMSRHYLAILPAVLLLAACNSPNDGTTQSETETVPADDGAVASPTDMSTPDSGSTAADGTSTDSTATDGTATTGTAPMGAMPGETGAGTTLPDAATGSGADTSSTGTAPTDKRGTPPPAK
jgi:hypothetical protein